MSSISSHDIRTCVPDHDVVAEAPGAVDVIASRCMPCATEVCDAKKRASYTSRPKQKHKHIYGHIYVCVHEGMYMSSQICIWIEKDLNIYIYVYMYVHVYVCICINILRIYVHVYERRTDSLCFA